MQHIILYKSPFLSAQSIAVGMINSKVEQTSSLYINLSAYQRKSLLRVFFERRRVKLIAIDLHCAKSQKIHGTRSEIHHTTGLLFSIHSTLWGWRLIE